MNSNPRSFSLRRARGALRPHSAAVFLGVLLLLIVTAPLVQELPGGEIVDASLITLVLCSAVAVVGAGWRATIAAALLAAPAVVLRWSILFWPGWVPAWIAPAAWLLFVAFMVVLLVRFTLLAPRVTSEVLCAAVSAYLLLGLVWATAYLLVGRTVPGSFAGLAAGRSLLPFDALYLSIITLTTVGYGDIAPVSAPARMLALTEAITGTMYMAVLVARLVSLYTVEASGAAERREQP